MKTNLILTSAVILTMVGTGCATKKYVAKTMAPVEARVTTAEAKNADQDKLITAQAGEIDTLGRNLSRTNERVTDADTKATAAGQAAQRANEAASTAQRSADGAMTAAGTAQRSAEGALTAANNAATVATTANTRTTEVERKVDSALKLTMSSEETVLFGTNQSALSKEGKEVLDAFAGKLHGKERYMVEVQGFTDKTGSPEGNAILSQRRAEAVTRYLVNEHKLPLHQVTMLGSGYAAPEGDDKTRDGRKQNRRVEVRLFVPETVSLSAQK